MVVGKRVVIIDGNAQCYRMYYKMPPLRFAGFNTAIIFGFIQALAYWKTIFKPDIMMVCWDDKSSQHRIDILPNYRKREKGNKVFDSTDFYWQRETIMAILNSLNIIQYFKKGMEADDLIYYWVRKYRKKNRVIIVSRDKDFKPLIGPHVKMWDDHSKAFLYSGNFEKVEGIKLENFLDYLCLRGDKSDNIPGYPGIGHKNALKILQSGSVKQFLNDNSIQFNFVEKSELAKTYKRNRQLIDLSKFYWKYMVDKELKEYKGSTRKLDVEVFKANCIRLGFKRFKDKAFYNPFGLINKQK